MATPAAQAHIAAQERLRTITSQAVGGIWTGLPGYDDANVDEWLSRVVPLVLAGQRASVSLTEAFIARAIGRHPLGVDPGGLIGPALRAGADPAEVYRRPFVTVWTALKAGQDWEAAVNAGLARATSTAATDVQLAMRGTLAEVGNADPAIHGYERVPDAGACDLCLIASTQRYHSGELMPIHNHCGCGVEVLTEASTRGIINRDRYRDLKQRGVIDDMTQKRRAPRARERAAANRTRAERVRSELAAETDPARRLRLEERASRLDRQADAQDAIARGVRPEVREHGELGPVLVNGDHDFTAL